MSFDSPTKVEAESNIRLLKWGKLSGPDELIPLISKLDRVALTNILISLLPGLWNEERIAYKLLFAHRESELREVASTGFSSFAS